MEKSREARNKGDKLSHVGGKKKISNCKFVKALSQNNLKKLKIYRKKGLLSRVNPAQKPLFPSCTAQSEQNNAQSKTKKTVRQNGLKKRMNMQLSGIL